MPEFGEPKFEQKKEMTPEMVGQLIEELHEEYAVFVLDRELQMTEVEYLKMKDIENRLPDLDEYEEGVLTEEVVMATVFLSEFLSEKLGEMEEYFKEHGNQWADMTS